MKYKNSLITLFFIIIWFVNNSSNVSFQAKISSAEPLSNLNFLLNSMVGLFMVTYLYIFYSCPGNMDIKEHYILRSGRKKYIFNTIKARAMDSLYYSVIYSLISLTGNLLFVKISLLFSQNAFLFLFMQFIALFLYLVLVSLVFTLIWVLFDFKKVSMWVTAVFMTLICLLPVHIMHPLNGFLEADYLIKSGSVWQNFISMAFCVLYTLILFVIVTVIFTKKDITRVSEHEK